VEIKIPAEVDESTAQRIQDVCVQAYRALACEDFARVDLFLSKDGEVYINEINTIPGFTNSSMFPSLWGQHGISYQELITQIIDLAVERFEHKNQLQREYLGDSG
jgi:D-alanine-D-alanine ligase